MEQYINKPRVFLSHSEKDDEFVSKLPDDLRKCKSTLGILNMKFSMESHGSMRYSTMMFEKGLNDVGNHPAQR